MRKDSTAVCIVAYVINTRQEHRQFHPNHEYDDSRQVADFLGEYFNVPRGMICKRYGQVEYYLRTGDATRLQAGFDAQNMGRRGLYQASDGGYSNNGRGGVVGGI